MRVSLFEIWKITQRCLEAAGVPAGHDREGAFATMWLAEHGFPAVNMVSGIDLSRGADWALTLTRTGEAAQLDAAGLSLVSLAIDAVDLAVADASQSEGGKSARVTIINARAPVFLLPFAARRTRQSGVFSLHWRIAEDAIGVTVAGEELWIDGGGLEDLNNITRRCDVTVTYDTEAGPDRIPAACLLTPEQISDRRRERLSLGIEVNEAHWSRMVQMSQAVLVPDSDESRARGAGGGNAND